MTHKLLIICILSLLAITARAQQSSVISYQGVLAKDGVAVTDGDYTITVTLYHDSLGAKSAWSGWYYVHTTNGVFNVLLGSGDYPLPSASQLDGPLFIGLRIGAGAELPLTQLSSAVNALNVADGSITAKKMGTDYVSSISVNGQKVTGNGTGLNIVGNVMYDDASKSILVNAGGSTADSSGKGANAETHNGTSDYWGQTGNKATNPDTNYVGTSDSVAFEIHVNNSGFLNNGNGRVVRYEPQEESPNIIAGWNGNSVTGASSVGETISGGGKQGAANQIVNGDLSTIGGGDDNYIKARIATIAGGENGKIYSQAATIGGGVNNTAGTTSDSSFEHQTVGGGNGNTASGDDAVVAGGEINTASGFHSGIGGGFTNQAISHIAYVGGGDYNKASGDSSAILGGAQNTASGESSAILGGFNNYATGKFSSVLGGRRLELGDSSVGYSATNSPSVVDLDAFHNVAYFGNVDLWVGNVDDTARELRLYGPNGDYHYTSSTYSAFRAASQDSDIIYTLPTLSPDSIGRVLAVASISGPNIVLTWGAGGGGGGLSGWQLTGNAGTVPGTNYLGTQDNEAFEIHIHDLAPDKTGGNKRVMLYEEGTTSPDLLGGSSYNIIASGLSGNSIMGGGDSLMPNKINQTLSTFGYKLPANFNFVGGGEGNVTWSEHDVIGGGRGNIMMADTFRSGFNFIGGGDSNIVGWGSYDNVIAGGKNNDAANAYGVVSGGYGNLLNGPGSYNVISGGQNNTVGGTVTANANTQFSIVGGGYANMIDSNSNYASILGGRQNYSLGDYSVVSGGDSNWVTGSRSIIVGGCHNNVISTEWGTIVGGCGNNVTDTLTFIGGGSNNKVSGSFSNIMGGDSNIITSHTSSIAGGIFNSIDTAADISVIGGGQGNHIQLGSLLGVIGGGFQNYIESASFTATVGGGSNNIASGDNSAIPGGNGLIAQGYSQFVAGSWNIAEGSTHFAGGDDYIAIYGNGIGSGPLRSNAWMLSNSGHSIVTHNLPNGDSTIYGASYTNNTIIAWGNYNAPAVGSCGTGGGLYSGIGVTVVPQATGLYWVELMVKNPDGTPHIFTAHDAAIVVTPTAGSALGPAIVNAGDLTVSGTTYYFPVHTYYFSGGTPTPNCGIGFQFHVVAQ